jgi:hypothetical protein
VHNDTDEDWQNVAVELVEGRPNSYLFPFVTPRFRHREVLPPEEGLETAPQLAGTNADALAGVGVYGHGYGTGSGDSYGYGYGAGGLGMFGTGMGGGGSAEPSQLLAVGELATEAQASPEQRRELLSYRATEPLSLPAHESALVPVIDSGVSAERVSVVDAAQNVLAALKVRNDTGYALREGPLAVFDAGFAGQTWMPRMYVDDARVLPHGADLDVVAALDSADDVQETKIVRWFRPERRESAGEPEQLEEHYVLRTTRSYALSSHASSERTVCIRLPALLNGRVVSGGDAELLTAEDGNDYYHMCAVLAAGAEQTREVVTEEGLMRSWTAAALDSATLRDLAAMGTLPPETRAILAQAAAAIAESEAAIVEAQVKQNQSLTLSAEIARHRVDLAALAGSGADEDVATDIAERMVEAGQRMDALALEVDAARVRSDAAREKAAGILRALPAP